MRMLVARPGNGGREASQAITTCTQKPAALTTRQAWNPALPVCPAQQQVASGRVGPTGLCEANVT